MLRSKAVVPICPINRQERKPLVLWATSVSRLRPKQPVDHSNLETLTLSDCAPALAIKANWADYQMLICPKLCNKQPGKKANENGYDQSNHLTTQAVRLWTCSGQWGQLDQLLLDANLFLQKKPKTNLSKFKLCAKFRSKIRFTAYFAESWTSSCQQRKNSSKRFFCALFLFSNYWLVRWRNIYLQ